MATSAQASERARGGESAFAEPGLDRSGIFRRRHWMEIHEQSWCPASLRNEVTSFLEAFSRVVRVYDPLRSKLASWVRGCGASRVVDLCSGSGGPWPSWLLRRGGDFPPILLTDSFPNGASLLAAPDAGVPVITYHPHPVDALAMPRELRGFRTLFAGLHHFRPAEAVALLREVVAAGEGVAVLESSRRHPASMAAVLALPITLFFCALFLRPFRWSRVFWTYLVPALPVVLALDGWVSCWRTYSPKELRDLARQADPEQSYSWESGRRGMGRLPLAVTYLMGRPRGED